MLGHTAPQGSHQSHFSQVTDCATQGSRVLMVLGTLMSKGLPTPAGSLLQAKGPPRVQEGSQEPGSQEAAESAAQGLGPGLSRKGGGQAAGVGVPDSYLLLLPGGSMGLDLSRGQAPLPGRGGASTVSPNPPPQPFPRRRNRGGGARAAGL